VTAIITPDVAIEKSPPAPRRHSPAGRVIRAIDRWQFVNVANELTVSAIRRDGAVPALRRGGTVLRRPSARGGDRVCSYRCRGDGRYFVGKYRISLTADEAVDQPPPLAVGYPQRFPACVQIRRLKTAARR
jgi:hypothetical protein